MPPRSAGETAPTLRSLATEPELQRFYERAGWRVVWNEAATRALEDAIAHRADQGIDRLPFLPSIEAAQTPVARDVALTRAALRLCPSAGDGRGGSGDAARGLYPASTASAAPAPSRLYTGDVADAVRALQRDHGLAEDGVVGPRTIEVLNLSPADRARAIAVALERLRWLARNPPATRIDVNITAARLTYYRDGVPVDTRKVIVGKPGRETPLLSSPIYRLVANPTWTIPKSIENSELAHVGPDYLASHNMVRRGGYIVQQPGPDNALGMVKFDMVNDQAIYLHDTSAPGLFERSQRHLSHGCVRVDDALGFAQLLAEDEGVANRWQAASASGAQTFVPLPVRIPVRLLYQNAFVDEVGRVTVRTDPYDWNGPVARALGFDDGAHTMTKADVIDIGP